MYLIYKGYLLLISHFLFSWVSDVHQMKLLALRSAVILSAPPHMPLPYNPSPSAHTICLYHLLIPSDDCEPSSLRASPLYVFVCTKTSMCFR